MRKYFAPWLIVERYFLTCKEKILYEYDLRGFPFQNPKIQMNVRQARLEDMEKLAEMRATEKNSSEHNVKQRQYFVTLLKRLKADNYCFIAEKNNEILGYLWIAVHELFNVEMDRNLLLSDTSVMLYDLYTFSSYRGLGVAPTIMEQTFKFLRENNFKNAYVFVDYFNKSSRKTNEKYSKMIDVITSIKFFGFSYLTHRVTYRNIRLETVKK